MRSKTATRLANRSVVAVILVCLMLFSVSIGTASGASHNVRRARPNATWVSAWDWGTWVWSGPPCNCYYHPVLAWDSNVVNPVLIINANLNLSRPLTLEPTGVAVSGVSLFTYTRRNAIVYDAVYSLSSDKTTAKLVRTIKPPGEPMA